MENALPRTWSLCMTSENHGTVGPAGCTFSHAPDKHERVLVAEVPAAANKAAEEGGLPVLPHTTYNGYSDGSEPLWTKEQMHGYARQAIAADRASREVANKAEVEPAAWLIEPTSVAHKGMKREVQFDRPMVLKSDFTVTPLYATPPATTGASTVLTDERIADMVQKHYGTQVSQADRDFAREVAAQAGQVAVPDEQLEWSHDLQERLIAAAQDCDEHESVRQVMAEAACLLAALTGVKAPTSGERQEGGAS